MTDKPRVMWILESSGLAGGVRCIFEYANGLAALGFPVSFYALHDRPKWFDLHRKIDWTRFGSYEALIPAAVNAKPDIAIGNWWRTSLIVREICDQSPTTRGFYLVQDIESSYYHDPATRGVVMSTYELGLTHFTTSKWVMTQLPDCHYVGLAIGKKWRPQPSVTRKRQVLAVMRRQALKGFRELAEVTRYLFQKSVRVVTFGQDKGVRLAGMHEHIHDPSDKVVNHLYAESAVFISTSKHEGLSMTPLEAMATGTPVVMFDADGNREYAEHDVNCLIATDPADMAAQVVTLLNDAEMRAKLSRNGLVTARRYSSWQEPIDRLASLLGG